MLKAKKTLNRNDSLVTFVILRHRHVHLSWVILCQEVRESDSLYAYICILFLFTCLLIVFFFLSGSLTREPEFKS